MKRNTHLFDLYWEDIIVSKILPRLTLRECFTFRCASRTCLQLADMYFAKMKTLKLMNNGFSPHTFCVFIRTCETLKELNLSKCEAVTDAGMIPLLRRNPKLQRLTLSGCPNVSAKCLQPAILHCQLTSLHLSRSHWLTTGAVEALALHQARLQDVDFSFCPCIAESCILIFIKKFRHLKYFNLEGDRQVTDKVLFALATYSKELRLLNLGGCTEVTDKGVKYLALHNKVLEGLLVRGCGGVTERSLQLLRGRAFLDRAPMQAPPAPPPRHLLI